MTTQNRTPSETEGPNRQRRRHPDLPPEVLDRFEAATYANVGLTLLAEATASGAIRSLKVGRRRLYRISDLNLWLDAHAEGGPDAA